MNNNNIISNPNGFLNGSYVDTNNVAENAGKQNGFIAVQNAIIVAEQLIGECEIRCNYAIAYALQLQLTYLRVAQKHLMITTTTTNEK